MIRTLVASMCLMFVAACAGGSGTVGSSGSSSGGSSGSTSSSGSSGPSQCDGICNTGATLTFDEANDNGRLDGALLETCFRDRCAQGRIEKRDAGTGYELNLVRTFDGGADPLIEGNILTSATPGALRFRIDWMLGFGSPAGVADGDTYTVSARTSPSGPELFNRSFVATYRDTMVCGSRCKSYTSPAP